MTEQIMNVVNIFLGDLPPELTLLKYVLAFFIGIKFIQLIFNILLLPFKGGRF